MLSIAAESRMLVSVGIIFLLVSVPGSAPRAGFVSRRAAAVSLESVPAAVPVSPDDRLLEHAATANANGRASVSFRR